MNIVSIAFALIHIKKFNISHRRIVSPAMPSEHKPARVCRIPGYPGILYVNRENVQNPRHDYRLSRKAGVGSGELVECQPGHFR